MAAFSSLTHTSSLSPTPTNTGSSSRAKTNSTGNITSLSLHAFLATLSFLIVIVGAVVWCTTRLRRRRAVAAGTHVSPSRNGSWHYDHLLPTPMLREVHIAPTHDPKKGWDEILPVAGAPLVLGTCQTYRPSRVASWSPRQLFRFARGQQSTASAVADLSAKTPPTAVTTSMSLEPPKPPSPPSSGSVQLAVLISMPTRTARRKVEHEIRGAPVVEFGVAHVAYARPAEP
ncbi:hypothetical protein EI94DRAFT_1032754 [Lactarius quietus]|nr:hypothetical protein EI94DRAFT_1032754 [Lactarius quietus]